ncbi:MipA/OmpV family protein [Croceicoccus sp. F390]|uniref:MipA/OmpV family protein n=1 Tax=Croceicoccus esteveae TaxID=3075597 RepID=A0ABU2ZK27_9SPHN|nr:MipA/OmpV family protein [Croceicoccus sp. F390]MDT0576576.1 MipA/OmpV family protein [Croceicoccus sp. F390]
MPSPSLCRASLTFGAACLAMIALPVQAQEAETFQRVRVGVGPGFGPAYPGAGDVTFGPYFDIDLAADGELFGFESPDESFGIPVVEFGGFYIGPAIALTGKRKQEDTAPGLRTIGTTIEPGVALQAELGDRFYTYAEVRRGINGHNAFTGQAGVDYIVRAADSDFAVSVGPRLKWGDAKHAQAYFGVTDAEALASGLDAYDPDGGIQSVGGVASIDLPIDGKWGLMSFAGYQRLVGDAADSPVTRLFGSRDQWTGGVVLTYTFRRKR